ncbi:MAG: universal stress protein [Verrucomicrobia bacterium]|nr:universal stress protein [Verrucomicrobiota bacterium]
MATLLVPLDTSEIAPKVLLEAESLAVKLRAKKVILFHVIEPVATCVPVGAAMDMIATSPPDLDMAQTDVAKSRLEQLAAPLRAKGLEVACEALFGMPVDEILDQAKTQGADYIILGSHGHGALFHLFGGSVVTGVLKHSPCPVVVVPVRK